MLEILDRGQALDGISTVYLQISAVQDVLREKLCIIPERREIL